MEIDTNIGLPKKDNIELYSKIFRIPETDVFAIQQRVAAARTDMLSVIMGMEGSSSQEIEKEYFRRNTEVTSLKALRNEQQGDIEQLFRLSMDINRIRLNIGIGFDDEEVNSIAMERTARAYAKGLGLDESLSIFEIAELIAERGIRLADLEILLDY